MYQQLLATLRDETKIWGNLVGGEYVETKSFGKLVDPLNSDIFTTYCNTGEDEITPFLDSLKACPKSGLHNPFKNVERYRMLGEVSFRAAVALENEEVFRHFVLLIQKYMPKSLIQCEGEVRVVIQFLKNFSGDQPRFLAKGMCTVGDRVGQSAHDHRYPFGPVAVIPAFNFPLEIPGLQIMGALYMGNKVLLKCATTTSAVMDHFMALLHFCGLPMEDVDVIHCSGKVMNALLERGKDIIRLVQFTGSSKTLKSISEMMEGRVKSEDAGFNWKIIDSEVHFSYYDYVAWQSDQDAYAASGQKCSAQSILFLPKKLWFDGFQDKLAYLASVRNLSNLTVGPVLTWTTDEILTHIEKLCKIPDAELLFGGKPLVGHNIPLCYGAIEPTAVYIPLEQILRREHFNLVTTEVFGPVQVMTTYDDETLPQVLEVCERMKNHLTAAVVSSNQAFINKILGATINGTTYVGILARTTGAPQWHSFRSCGDSRGANIGTPEAIRDTWSCGRCVIYDEGPLPFTSLIQS